MPTSKTMKRKAVPSSSSAVNEHDDGPVPPPLMTKSHGKKRGPPHPPDSDDECSDDEHSDDEDLDDERSDDEDLDDDASTPTSKTKKRKASVVDSPVPPPLMTKSHGKKKGPQTAPVANVPPRRPGGTESANPNSHSAGTLHDKRSAEDAPRASQPLKKAARCCDPRLAGINPIVFQTFKLLIDRFNEGTDSIVNVDGFVEECQRILQNRGAMKKALHTAALLTDFTFVTPVKGLSCFANATQKITFGRLFNSLKTKLTKLAEDPNCKSLMVTLVVAFP